MEIWKDIQNYEGLYQASNYGNLSSYARLGTKGGILKGGKDKDGYLLIILYKDGKRETRKFHRLIAETFIPNPNNYPMVNHKNGIKYDNRLENLEWCTARENAAHYYSSTNKSSKYVGVRFYKNNGKWNARISIDKKLIHLGYFDTEILAANAYQQRLQSI
jgi:hypothetical protein